MARNFTKQALLGFAAVCASALMAAPASAQNAELAVFSTSDEQSSVSLNYRPWNEFMNAYTVTQGDRVTIFFDGIESNGTTFLNSWVNFLEGVNPSSLSKTHQQTYWLNLHNALVVDALVKQSRRRNLNRARGTGAEPGELWTAERVTVEGVDLSIQDVEDVIAANFANPLNFYALYQGVEGGPALPKQALTPNSLQASLQEAAAKFLSSRQGLRGVRRGNARLSGVYEWYLDDFFGGDTAALLEHVKTYARGRSAQDLSEASSVDFQNVNYRAEVYEVRVERQLPASPRGGSSSGSGS